MHLCPDVHQVNIAGADICGSKSISEFPQKERSKSSVKIAYIKKTEGWKGYHPVITRNFLDITLLSCCKHALMASGNESGSTLPEKENIYWDISKLKFFLL